VRDAEPATFTRSRQAALQRAHVPHAAQRGHPASHLQRHMTRKPRREGGTRPMPIARIRSALAARSCAASAPARRVAEFEPELSLSHTPSMTDECVGDDASAT
jgi:hypothetical protein